MRFLLSLLVCIFCFPLAGNSAQDDTRLDDLFPALKSAKSLDVARGIEANIWTIWGEIQDPESAALLQLGTSAMGKRAWGSALEHFTELVDREPDFAEAWNKRATLYYLIGDYGASIKDIAETLKLEPRHFGALSGLGLVYMRLDKPGAALKSFEAALELHPMMPGARSHVEVLREQVSGNPI